jgi:hypothetical protein
MRTLIVLLFILCSAAQAAPNLGFSVKEKDGHLVVDVIHAGTRAAQSDIQPGDVLIQVRRKSLNSCKDLLDTIKHNERGTVFEARFRSGGREYTEHLPCTDDRTLFFKSWLAWALLCGLALVYGTLTWLTTHRLFEWAAGDYFSRPSWLRFLCVVIVLIIAAFLSYSVVGLVCGFLFGCCYSFGGAARGKELLEMMQATALCGALLGAVLDVGFVIGLLIEGWEAYLHDSILVRLLHILFQNSM